MCIHFENEVILPIFGPGGFFRCWNRGVESLLLQNLKGDGAFLCVLLETITNYNTISFPLIASKSKLGHY